MVGVKALDHVSVSVVDAVHTVRADRLGESTEWNPFILLGK